MIYLKIKFVICLYTLLTSISLIASPISINEFNIEKIYQKLDEMRTFFIENNLNSETISQEQIDENFKNFEGTYFFELNYKNKKVRQLKNAILKNKNVSTEFKNKIKKHWSIEKAVELQTILQEFELSNIILLPKKDLFYTSTKIGDFKATKNKILSLQNAIKILEERADRAKNFNEIIPDIANFLNAVILCLNENPPRNFCEREELENLYFSLKINENSPIKLIFKRFPEAHSQFSVHFKDKIIQIMLSESFLLDFEFEQKVKMAKEKYKK